MKKGDLIFVTFYDDGFRRAAILEQDVPEDTSHEAQVMIRCDAKQSGPFTVKRSKIFLEGYERQTRIRKQTEMLQYPSSSSSTKKTTKTATTTTTNLYSMVAARYVDPSTSTHCNKENCIQVRWNEGSCTWEPPSTVLTIDKEFLDKLHNNAGKRIDFDGARSADSEECWKSSKLFESIISSDTVNRSDLMKATTTSTNIHFQTQGRLCALNAVANATPIPPELYDELKKENPALEAVVKRVFREGIAKVTRVKVEFDDNDLHATMLKRKSGVFAVRFITHCESNHCATWDATSQVILDTDPKYSHPMPINEYLETLKPLGKLTKVPKVTKAYEIVPCANKRLKRMHASSTETTTAAAATTAPSEAPLEAPSAGSSIR